MSDIATRAYLRRQVMLAAAGRWQDRRDERASNTRTVDASGPGAADSAMRQTRYQARSAMFARARTLRSQGQLPVFIERKIGPTLDFLPSAPTDAARTAGRPVARIVTSVDPSRVAEGFASGFLISPLLLLTNHHVFPTKASAFGTGANFLHDFDGQGVKVGITFAVKPDTFYFSDEALDFAIVAIDAKAVTGEAIEDLGILGLSEATSKILLGQGVNLVEYPDGGQKQYVTQNNHLIDILNDGFLHYESDTLEGSSGCPAFSEQWELVALHHAAIPEVRDGKIMCTSGEEWMDGMPEDTIHWVANEGIRISAIIASLNAARLDDPAQAKILKDLLSTTTDPADEISRLITNGRAPEALPLANPPPDGVMTSMGTMMNFTGPVTIHVYAPSGAAAGPQGGSAPVAPALEKALRFDPNYDDREGYNPNFLGNGIVVPAPAAGVARSGEMYTENGAVVVLNYHHYSLAMNRDRRLQMWSAVNVDYDPNMRQTSGRAFFGTDRWIPDPRIPAAIQIMDPDFYGPAGQVDRGHIVRREDSAWGGTPEATEFANSDTFHWTNCTPQHAAFNRERPPSKQYGDTKGLWGGFEAYVQQQLQHGGDTKACILAGPMLLADDPTANFGTGSIQYPVKFWKVVAVSVSDPQGGRSLRTYGFILSQADVVDKFGIEFAVGQYGRYQQPLAEIAIQAGIVFDKLLLDADTHA